MAKKIIFGIIGIAVTFFGVLFVWKKFFDKKEEKLETDDQEEDMVKRERGYFSIDK